MTAQADKPPMAFRVKALIACVLLGTATAVETTLGFASHGWWRFGVYLAAVLLSSGMKVPMPRGDSSMSVNFPFIFLALIQLSVPQALALAALSVFAQCNFRVQKIFTLVQIAFNVGNSVNATACAAAAYLLLLHVGVANAPAITLSAIAFFFASTVPVALIVGWTKKIPVFPLWREDFLWYLPFYMMGAVLATIVNFVSIRYGWSTSLLIAPVVYTIYRSYMTQIARLRDREQHLEEMAALNLRAIEGLAMAIEARDQNTHDHLLRVRVYVSEIGEALKLSTIEIQAVITAALLHDIGKLAVPEHIINKPGKLSHEEFEKIKIHPVVGAEILERVRFPYPVVPIVRSHHEWWNGMGYPDGLVGEAIPIGARILTVVDCFDALASDRPYRLALPIEEAMAMVKKAAGTQFDPKVVKILEERYVELEAKARTEGEKLPRLDTTMSVNRGLVPGAGFEEDSAPEPAPHAGECVDEWPRQGTTGSTPNGGGLQLVAATTQEVDTLLEMSRLPGSSLSLSDTIAVMTSRLRGLITFDCLVLYLRKDGFIVPQHHAGDSGRYFVPGDIPMGQGVSGWVAQSGRPIVNGNAGVEPNFLHHAGDDAVLKSALSIPLLDAHGDLFGVLTLYSATPVAFSRDHLRMLQTIEAKFSVSLSNVLRARAEGSQIRSAELAGIIAARGVLVELEAGVLEASRAGGLLAVVVCDLYQLRRSGDERGSKIEDVLLQSLMKGFRGCCRPTDTVAKLDGQEFAFLIPGITEESASDRLEAIARAVAESCRDVEDKAPVALRMGAAFYPTDTDSAEELLALAYGRMHQEVPDRYAGGRMVTSTTLALLSEPA